MNYKLDYLLKYVTNDTYHKIITYKGDYLLELLQNNRIDVDLNIRYLIKYGINHIDNVIYERVEDLVLPHNDFITKIKKYEQSLGKASLIDMLENL